MLDARSFHVAGAASRWTYEPPVNKTPARLVRVAPGETTLTFERFEPAAALSPTALAEYSGRYTSDESRMDWWIAVVDGHLVANTWGRPLMGASPFVPVARDLFTPADGVSFRFERDAHGRIRGFVFGQNRARGIRWVRR
jgi:hypothetical protein